MNLLFGSVLATVSLTIAGGSHHHRCPDRTDADFQSANAAYRGQGHAGGAAAMPTVVFYWPYQRTKRHRLPSIALFAAYMMTIFV